MYTLKGNFGSFAQSDYEIDNLDNTSWGNNCKLFKIPEEVEDPRRSQKMESVKEGVISTV